MSRDRSGLATTEPEKPKPGCTPDEVAARRLAAANARQELYKVAYGQEESEDVPKFADWRIEDIEHLDLFYEQMAAKIGHGAMFRVRVRAME